MFIIFTPKVFPAGVKRRDVVGDGQNIFCIQIWPVDKMVEGKKH